MKVFAKFDEIPSMILEVLKETKRYGHTDGRSDNVKTVYPPTNTVCGGIIMIKTLIYRTFFYKNSCMMSQEYRKSISMKIIKLYSKTLRATWQVL